MCKFKLCWLANEKGHNGQANSRGGEGRYRLTRPVSEGTKADAGTEAGEGNAKADTDAADDDAGADGEREGLAEVVVGGRMFKACIRASTTKGCLNSAAPSAAGSGCGGFGLFLEPLGRPRLRVAPSAAAREENGESESKAAEGERPLLLLLGLRRDRDNADNGMLEAKGETAAVVAVAVAVEAGERPKASAVAVAVATCASCASERVSG